tara:strand:+ start:1993 stop:2355 length:363 start_codon:yes stop_codon:yes gene_type:complete
MTIIFTFLTDETMKLEIAPILGDLQNVVTRVRYNYVGIDEEGNEETFAGVTPMPVPEDTLNFKAFADLLPENVVAWLEVTADKTHMQEIIKKQIEDKLYPKNEPTPSPWAVSKKAINSTI